MGNLCVSNWKRKCKPCVHESHPIILHKWRSPQDVFRSRDQKISKVIPDTELRMRKNRLKLGCENDFPYHPSLLAFFLVVAGECKLIVRRSYEVPAVVLFAAHSWRRADGHCWILEQDQIKCMEGSDQSMKVHW